MPVLLSEYPSSATNPEQKKDSIEIASIGHGGILYNNPPNSDVGKLIGIRINNIELVNPKMRNGWLVFDLDPNYLAIGKNLIGINFMNSKYNKIIRLDIEKLEIHVVYKK